MSRRRLLWQLFPPYLIVTLLALATVGILAAQAIHDFYLTETTRDLIARGRLVRERVMTEISPGEAQSFASIDALCKKLGRDTDTRITVILSDGRVVGDSDEPIARMESHLGSDRPEIMRALEGHTGQAIRYSRTLRRSMLYIAVPMLATPAGDPRNHPAEISPPILAIVRVAIPLASVRQTLGSIHTKIALGTLGVALLCALVSWLIARRLSRPLEDLRRGAEAFARGDLDQRLTVFAAEEIEGLARSMNRMAEQLNRRIATITRQSNEREAILHSMVEGVLALDNDGNIVALNPAASRMFDLDTDRAIGRSVLETLRIPALHALIERTLRHDLGVQEADITLHRDTELQFQVHCAPLRDGRGERMGAIVVANDITRLRRLENIRRDFVANVSHELKTPITSIKAAVETLQDGAIRDPQPAAQFLDMIARKSARLEAIIEDLLNLSRIERDVEAAAILLRSSAVEPVVDAAVQACRAKAIGHDIEIHVTHPPEALPHARMNPALIENAIGNLLDNAIKYSPPQTRIDVVLSASETEVIVSVTDQGCGIAAEDQERIFERFFRVDRARGTANGGGTGLGLAIVKHIMQAHRGQVTLASAEEEGSTFRLHLPRENARD